MFFSILLHVCLFRKQSDTVISTVNCIWNTNRNRFANWNQSFVALPPVHVGSQNVYTYLQRSGVTNKTARDELSP